VAHLDTGRRFAPLTELGRFTALLGLTGAAIAQPVLAAFGDSPETFIFRRAQGADLVRFALLVVVVPPLVLWALGALVGLVWPAARAQMHGASAGLLVGLAVAEAAASLPAPVVVVLAAAVGVLAWTLLVRSPSVRLWSQFLALLPVYSLVVFLVASPASDAFGSSSFEAARNGGSTTPIVLIVLDELPTDSLITADGSIDPMRYPNLAGFARDATWYRNATTVAGFTEEAVPAILTGRLPRRAAPFSTNYPDNLFRLVAGSHDLVVSEAITRLCPTSVCGDRPRSPVGGAAAPEVSADLPGLLGDAVSVWTDGITGRSHTRLRSDQFQEDVGGGVSLDDGLRPAGAADSAEPVAQPKRLTQFLDALRPGRRPIAAVVHLVSPHSPWRYLPDGRAYADPAEDSGLSAVYENDWVADVGRQTHILQTGYTDRLVGQVLRKLKAEHIYDDAAVAVVADHGVSFAPDHMRRGYTPETASEILWVPLLLKAPAQHAGTVDESNVETIDLVPTLASLAGIRIPWKVDGAVIGSPAIAGRGNRKTFLRFNNPIVQPQPDETLVIDGQPVYRQMLDDPFPAITDREDPAAGLYTLSGRAGLLGQPYQPYQPSGRATGALRVDERDRLLAEEKPVITLSGTVRSDGGGTFVVAAVGGRIVAVSPVTTRRDGDPGFELILPTRDPPALKDVRLGLIRGDGPSAPVLDAGPV
jgi:hypothetical protein